MAKKSGRKKIASRNIIKSSTNDDFLLGSSADTVNVTSSSNSELAHPFSHSKTGNIHKHTPLHPTQVMKKNQVYDFAILSDDIAEEAALLSSSEGYDAEVSLNSSSGSQSNFDLHSDTEDVDLENNYSNNTHGIYHHYNGSESIYSEISDSALLMEERDSYSLLKWYNRPSIFMISAILFLYAFSIGIAMSAELELIMDAVCFFVNGNLENCHASRVQQANASLQKWSNLICSIIKIIMSIQMGKLSDLHGRKPLILFIFILSALSKFSLIIVLTPAYFSFTRLILCNVIDACGGSLFVLLGLANSYAIDVVHERERLPSLGKITGALFLGLSLGPLSSSFLGTSFGVKPLTFITTSSVLLVISIIIILIFVPESRSSKLRAKTRRFSIRSQKKMEAESSLLYILGLTSFISSFKSLKLLWITRPKNFKASIIELINNDQIDETSGLLQQGVPINPINTENLAKSEIDMDSRINVLILLTIEILVTFCSVGSSLPVALYLMYTFNFTQPQLGLFVGVASGLRAFSLTIFNPWFQHNLLNHLHHDAFNVDFIDITSISFAIGCELLAALLCSISSSFFVICLYIIFSAISAIGSPIIHASLLKYNSSPGKNGEFFGALALIRNIINLISPWVFLTVYSFGVGIGKPHAIFYIILAFYNIAAILLGNLRFKNIFE